MKRLSLFIDGYNLYYSIKNRYPQYKWLNLYSLAEQFCGRNDQVKDVYFFTAYYRDEPQKKARLELYIKALASKNVKTILGKFKKKTFKCRVDCGHPANQKRYQGYEEKETDVNLSVRLLDDALNNKYDKAIIVSGDSDLIPAIKAVKKNFPSKKIGLALPINQFGNDLKEHCDFTLKISQKIMNKCKMEEKITLANGKIIISPYATAKSY
jgi:uncharacterized LabA/DUF88 family protein